MPTTDCNGNSGLCMQIMSKVVRSLLKREGSHTADVHETTVLSDDESLQDLNLNLKFKRS